MRKVGPWSLCLNMTTQSEQLVIPGNIQSGDSRWGLKAEISRGIEESIYCP